MSGTRRGQVPDMAAKSSVGSASRHNEGPPDHVVGRVVPAILGQEEQVLPAEDHHGRVRPFAERLARGGLESVRQIDRVAERQRCGGRPAHGLGGGGGGMALEKPTRAPLGNRRTPRCSGRAPSLLRQCHRLPHSASAVAASSQTRCCGGVRRKDDGQACSVRGPSLPTPQSVPCRLGWCHAAWRARRRPPTSSHAAAASAATR